MKTEAETIAATYIDEAPTELPEKWKLPEDWSIKALKRRPEWTQKHVNAAAKVFHAYHRRHGTTRRDMGEWEIAWFGWVNRQRTGQLAVKKSSASAQWWNSASGIESKGAEFGLKYEPHQCFAYFKLRVFELAGDGPWSRNA